MQGVQGVQGVLVMSAGRGDGAAEVGWRVGGLVGGAMEGRDCRPLGGAAIVVRNGC